MKKYKNKNKKILPADNQSSGRFSFGSLFKCENNIVCSKVRNIWPKTPNDNIKNNFLIDCVAENSLGIYRKTMNASKNNNHRTGEIQVEYEIFNCIVSFSYRRCNAKRRTNHHHHHRHRHQQRRHHYKQQVT